MTNENTYCWLRAMYCHDITPRQFFYLREVVGGIAQVFLMNEAEHRDYQLLPNQIAALSHHHDEKINRDLNWALQKGNTIITFDDPAYPALLREIADPPMLLFVSGNVDALSMPQMAIVGARHASLVGTQNAEKFASQLATSGYAITSGLALGVDGAAHRGALRVGGVTIGVAGTGLNHVYPRSHHTLWEEVLNHNGAILSEFPRDTPPLAHHFPRRNRIIAGLSLGVLVVEAALKSGSLITARLAAEAGRDVFALPGSIHHPLAKGCHHLIRQGAKLVETYEDILEELGALNATPRPKHSGASAKTKPSLPRSHQAVLRQIDYFVTPIDVITLRAQLTTGEVSSILLSLELNGYIQSIPGGYTRLA